MILSKKSSRSVATMIISKGNICGDCKKYEPREDPKADLREFGISSPLPHGYCPKYGGLLSKSCRACGQFVGRKK